MIEEIKRKTAKPEAVQESLFDIPCTWESHWWGMPEFVMGDARPLYRIVVNIATYDDLIEFGRRLGLRVTTNTDSLWFPPDIVSKPGDFAYADEP